MKRVCSVEGCGLPYRCRDLCEEHYYLWKCSDSFVRARKKPPIERLLEKVQVDANGCWVFMGGRTGGYGSVHVDGRKKLAHRLTYEHYFGPVPGGLDLDHLCRNRACCNPDHVEPVTRRENIVRGLPFRPQPDCCKYGHPWTDANTRINAAGARVCRECVKFRSRVERARQRERRLGVAA